MKTCCWKCGDDARPVTLVKDGQVIGTGALCDRCWTTAVEGAARLREQFEALLAAGVSREDANRIMIAKIDGTSVTA